MDDLFKYLDIDKSEWLEDIKHGGSSSASFMTCVEECISERESKKFEEGLNSKVKLDIYKRFSKSVEFKKYLHGMCDAGSRLLFKFRSTWWPLAVMKWTKALPTFYSPLSPPSFLPLSFFVFTPKHTHTHIHTQLSHPCSERDRPL